MKHHKTKVMTYRVEVPAGWKPYKVLSGYEAGVCIEAISAVARLDKPIVEVVGRRAKLSDLRSDLRRCVKESVGKEYGVKFWIRPSGNGRYRCGFYREEWALKALDFLSCSKLEDFDHTWISGLLFGYRPHAIQHFIDSKIKKARRATKR